MIWQILKLLLNPRKVFIENKSSCGKVVCQITKMCQQFSAFNSVCFFAVVIVFFCSLILTHWQEKWFFLFGNYSPAVKLVSKKKSLKKELSK